MAVICVVEDEPVIRSLLVDELMDLGHTVLSASDGEAGFKIISDQPPDLIISDVNMPRMNGFEMRRKLTQADPHHSKIPFVFLSAFADTADVTDGLVVGADAYLTKPVDFDVLAEWVDRLIEGDI